MDAGLVLAPQQSEAVAEPPQVTQATVSGYTWDDADGNGLHEGGEDRLADVGVSLLDTDGNSVANTTTGPDGHFQFDDVAAGSDYSLVFTAPPGYQHTAMDAGDDTMDSDADPSTGSTEHFILAEAGATYDAGFTPEAAAVPQQVCYGPNPEDFPEDISPLTGLPVDDPSLLSLRPVFLSISIFPPSVRPPTGLAVSPIVYELYIGDGDTRLMAGFYGQFPEPAYNTAGGGGDSAPTGFEYLIGDLVWFDSNGNHVQDVGEPGVPDVPVSLLDSNLQTVMTTTTDAQGHYYFGLNDVAPNTEYQLRFGAPPSISDYYWVNKDAGNDDIDSDVTELGRTDFFDPTDAAIHEELYFDAGLRQAYRIEGLRSGRVAYQDLQVSYCGCLITAGADPTVAAQITTCANAFSSDPSNIGGAGLDVTRLEAVAASSSEGSCSEPNLTGNLFCTQPDGVQGQNGQELDVEYNINNIDHFVYDPELNAYTWAKNLPSDPQNFVVMTDRLTAETLTFENVVVLLTQHTSENSANTIISLDMDHTTGTAYIFRNGQAYQAKWTTLATPYEQSTGKPLPVRFTDMDGNPFPLAPGQVWVNLLNKYDTVEMQSDGIWHADFDAPAYQP